VNKDIRSHATEKAYRRALYYLH